MPQLSIKLVIFTVLEDRLKVFLRERKLPSGEILRDKILDKSAEKILPVNLKTGVSDYYIEQLYTVSSTGKGKSGIAVVYYVLLPGYSISHKDEAPFADCEKIGKNISEYSIITYAKQRLQWKVEYTNVVYSLLADEFTLSQLQKAYEAVLGKELDKRNFRKKILSLGLLKSTGKKKKGEVARPALFYRFKSRKPEFVKVFS